MKVRVKVQPPDADCAAYHVHLPHYSMVPGSWQPLIAGKVDEEGVLSTAPDGKPVTLTPAETAELTCEVLMPDDECDDKGAPDKHKIRRKYKGQPRWDNERVLSDI